MSDSKYRPGTIVIKRDDDCDWEPYVLTVDGWIEVDPDRNFPIEESEIDDLIANDGWEIVYRGLQSADDGRES